MAEQELATSVSRTEEERSNGIVFNPDTPNVLTGFGVDIERLKVIVQPFIGQTINQFISSILACDITMEEKLCAIFECGCKFGEQYAIRQLMQGDEFKEVH